MSEIRIVQNQVMEQTQVQRKRYRFDVFKGRKLPSGKIEKVRSVGTAVLTEGSRMYTVYLTSFIKDVFYMRPEEKGFTQSDYVLLTKEPSFKPGKEFRWHTVGECKILTDENTGYLELGFDLLAVGDGIFMNLHPKPSYADLNKQDEVPVERDVA